MGPFAGRYADTIEKEVADEPPERGTLLRSVV